MPGITRAASGLVSTALVTALAGVALVVGGASSVQRLAGDALLRAASARAPEAPAEFPDALVVALDAQSLRARPDWPWPREHYARAIEQLQAAGVRAIAFDIDFSTPRPGPGDAAFAAATGRSGRVVLASFRQVEELPGGAALEVANEPVPELASAAAGLGSVLMPVDPDGVVRSAPRASRIRGRVVPSLAAAALAVVAPAAVEDRVENFPLDYRRAEAPVPFVPMIDVLEGRFDPGDVAGRVAFVGATAAEFQDLWATPLGPARPGVWIQAVAYRTLAAEHAGLPVLRGASFLATLLACALLALAAAALAPLAPGRRVAALAGLAVGFAAADAAWLVTRGVLLDPVLPLASLGLRYVLGLEGVRERLGRVLAQRDRSLATLARVGEVATTSPGSDPLPLALALLGDVVDADGVVLLRAAPPQHEPPLGQGGRRSRPTCSEAVPCEGQDLDGPRLEWRRRGGSPRACLDTARSVLAGREQRVFQGELPGGGPRGVAVYAPLFAGDAAVGVLVVERRDGEPLDATQLRTVATVGTQIALWAENVRLLEGLRRTFDSSIEAVASAIEARDGYTESHCRRLAVYSAAVADRAGLPSEEVEAVRLGALLHDVGKIGIRDEVLLKPGRFSPAERAEMERHADIGYRVVIPIHGLSGTAAACVRHHHERWDGGGYPDALAGEEIPFAARIVAVVDVWDALSTDRPYKKAYPPGRVRELLLKGRGGQFDPAVVDLFLRVLDEEGEELGYLAGRGGES